MIGIGKKLKILREHQGIKRRDAARLSKISYDYLAKIENGQRSPNLDVLGGIAGAIGSTLEDILGNVGTRNEYMSPLFPVSLPDARPIPRIGWARAGQWDEASDSGFEPGAADDFVYSDAGGEHSFSLRVEGDSMTPEFFEGEIIVVDPDREAVSGDFVIAKIEEQNEATFKQLKFHDGVPILHPLNPKYPEIEINSARIVGVVVEKKAFFGEADAREMKLHEISNRIESLDDKNLDRVIAALDLIFGGR